MLHAKHGFHPNKPTWIAGKTCLHSLIKEMAMRAGSNNNFVRWHSWRRFGAAQLKRLGARQYVLLEWGGWHNTSILRLYTDVPPTRKFEKGGPLPTPCLSASDLPQWQDVPGTTYRLWSPGVRKGLSKAGSAAPSASRAAITGSARVVALPEAHGKNRSTKND